jgi:hypothetical protein
LLGQGIIALVGWALAQLNRNEKLEVIVIVAGNSVLAELFWPYRLVRPLLVLLKKVVL